MPGIFITIQRTNQLQAGQDKETSNMLQIQHSQRMLFFLPEKNSNLKLSMSF